MNGTTERGRRQARRQALSLLYQWDLTGQAPGVLYEGDVDPFARALVEAVVARAEELDRRITEHSHGWPADRLGHAARGVRGIGVLELERAEVPPAVAIAEAVALAKRYASEDAARLVNGILGRIAGES
jgi:N utilization substance protein B